MIACRSAQDRAQWIRCLSLIIEMKNLGIDSGKINIFTYEYYREQQLK